MDLVNFYCIDEIYGFGKFLNYANLKYGIEFDVIFDVSENMTEWNTSVMDDSFLSINDSIQD